MTTLQPSNESPRLIRISTALLWAALALGLALQFMYAQWEFSVVLSSLFRGLILVFALHIYLITGIASGRNSARWLSLLFFIGGLFFSPPSVEGFVDVPMIVVTEITQISMQCFAFVGLFMRSSNAWFKARSAKVLANAR